MMMRGTIEVSEADYRRLRKEYEAMRDALLKLIACHDRPHRFDDEAWYAHALFDARRAIELTDHEP
jgi:hypothetical protein